MTNNDSTGNIINHINKTRLGIIMVKCLNCKRELTKPKKTWTYSQFEVQAYSCECGTNFREYTMDGEHSFTLQLKKGRFVKA